MGLKAVATLVPGGGPPVGGSGTPGKLAKFTGAGTSIGDSLLSESGTTITSAATAQTFGSAQTWTLAAGTSALNIQSGLLNLDTAGSRVGIGTAAPGSKLTIAGTAGTCVISMVETGVRNWAIRSGGIATNTFDICDLTAASSRLAITSTGNVGIGTASPTGRLHVAGGTAAAATNGAPVTIIAQSAGTGNQNGGNIVLTPGALSGSGSAGVADLSGPTGTGLKLPSAPGNTDAQTLDCYQENPLATTSGNGWTPTLSAAATWGGTQPNVTYARYVRMGSMVFCEVKLTMGAGTMTSAYPGTTIDSPFTTNTNATHSAVPVAAPGASGVGFQTGTTVYLPTIGASSTFILAWSFFA